MTRSQFEFESIGTSWTIDIFTPLSVKKENQILEQIKSRINIFDKTYSRFRDDSLITEISRKKGAYIFPQDARRLFSFYKKMNEVTDHLITPLIGQVLSDSGYDSNYSLVPKTLSKPPHWDEVLSYNHPKMETKKPLLLDFGAAGKGYLIDIIGELLRKNKIFDFCIDAGGDILHAGSTNESIRVGLEHPANPKQVIGVANIKNQSVCGSSGNRRNWGKYHHIINPYTLSSPKNILSTWAAADTALLADGMSTCLFFAPGKKLKEYFDFEYFILFDDYSYEKSPSFPSEVYTNVGTVTS